jgi:hypothetical protein
MSWIVLNQWSFCYYDTSYYWFPRFRGIVVGRCLPSYITKRENKIQGVTFRELATTNLLVEGTPSILYYPPDRLSSVMVHLPAPAYGVYLSQFIRYSRACVSYHFERFKAATLPCLTVMEYLCYKWPHICSACRKHFPVFSSFMTYHLVFN